MVAGGRPALSGYGHGVRARAFRYEGRARIAANPAPKAMWLRLLATTFYVALWLVILVASFTRFPGE